MKLTPEKNVRVKRSTAASKFTADSEYTLGREVMRELLCLNRPSDDLARYKFSDMVLFACVHPAIEMANVPDKHERNNFNIATRHFNRE